MTNNKNILQDKAKSFSDPQDRYDHESVEGIAFNLESITEAARTNTRKLIIANILVQRQDQRLAINLFKKICEITQLEYLKISTPILSSLPSEIGNLINLKELHFAAELPPLSEHNATDARITQTSSCKLSSLPSEIGRLRNLQILNLNGNKLTGLPTEIKDLKNLKILSVISNQLRELPIELGSLYQLEQLDLRGNHIQKLPTSLYNLNNLTQIGLAGNELSIPPEILKKSNQPKIILDYYFSSVEKSRKPLNEVKILIVGQGSVGKTSIIQRLVHNVFDENQYKTEGISIVQWQIGDDKQKAKKSYLSRLWQKATPQIQDSKSKDQVRLNLWDFGGQEIMHATHQFFLTKRSLYLLVLDSRLTQEENRVEYWLKIIQSFSDQSPILIVGNKTDQHPLDIDRTGLQKKYLNIVGILETSAATGAGIEELKAAITEQINDLPHVRDLIPETWFTVKTKLEGLGHEKNYISQENYLELCDENEVSDETSQRTLIGFLHDLGVVLHFQDDPRLEALGILNPQWVTNGVYKILNSHALFQNNGMLTISMLDEILNLPEYPRGKRLFIVDMMKKFELCYDIEPDKTFLVPDLLPKDEPAELKFNGIPAFEYAYPVLPSSVITRFIVRMNQHIHDGLAWRTGVLLKIGNNTALVKADLEDRKITISIDGVEHTRRDALSAIRYQLDEIHNSIKGLDAQKRVPIPEAPNAEPLDYDYLLQLERDGDLEVLPVKDGSRLVKVNIRQLLSGVESEAQRQASGGNVTNIYVGGNFDGNLTVGDSNQSIKDSYNKISSAKIDDELKETLKQLAGAVAIMAKSLPAEQATEVTEDLSRLVEEATKPKPSKKWYSLSVEGLIKAAENVEQVGEPVINLSRKVLLLLTGGV